MQLITWVVPENLSSWGSAKDKGLPAIKDLHGSPKPRDMDQFWANIEVHRLPFWPKEGLADSSEGATLVTFHRRSLRHSIK